MKKKNVCILTILFFVFFIENAFSMEPHLVIRYVPIDSLTSTIINQYVKLRLKENTVNVRFKDGSILTFNKSYSSGKLVQTRDSLTSLMVGKLLSFTSDSIYLSANKNTGSKQSFTFQDTISIHRSEMKGLTYMDSPKPQKLRSFYGGIGITLKNSDSEKEEHNKNYYTAELGYSIGEYMGVGYTLYGGSEFLFNKHKFLIAPKIGANVSFLLVILGNELIYYTDFKQSTLCYKPYLAFGILNFKFALGYNIYLCNKREFNLNTATLSLTIPFGMN